MSRLTQDFSLVFIKRPESAAKKQNKTNKKEKNLKPDLESLRFFA